MQALLDLVLKAGPLVWPILLASLVGLTLFVERAWTFSRYRRNHRELVAEVVGLVQSGAREQALAACRRARDPVAGVLFTLLRAVDLPKTEREQLVSASGSRQIQRMERGIRAIAVIARIAPLMGLLGTVMGLVVAFQTVAAIQGAPEPSQLAGGIWQALLTTVAGLVVAIPAILSHEWLDARIDEMVLQIQEAVAEVETWVGNGGPAAGPGRAGVSG